MSYAPIISFFLLATLTTQSPDIVKQRYSETTLKALRNAKDAEVFALQGLRPSFAYDSSKKTVDITPVLKWLNDQKVRSGAQSLDNQSLDDLKNVILSPQNHTSGLFAVGDNPKLAISIHSENKEGFITIGSSLLTIYWDGKGESGLMSETGLKAIAAWVEKHRSKLTQQTNK